MQNVMHNERKDKENVESDKIKMHMFPFWNIHTVKNSTKSVNNE